MMRTKPMITRRRPSLTHRLVGVLTPPLCLSVGLSLSVSGAIAQTDPAYEGAEQIEQSSPPRFTLTLGASASYRFESGFDSGISDVSVARVGASAQGAFLVGDSSKLVLTLGTEHSFYDFAPMNILVPGGVDPFDTIHDYTAGVRVTSQVNPTWAIIVGGGVISSGESSAEFSDTLNYNGLVGASYKINDSLTIGGAILVTTRLEDDVIVSALPTITWIIDERWRLETTDNGALLLSYKASDTLRVGFEGGYERREYRLDTTGPLPAGVVRERRIPVGVWTEWKPSPGVTLVGTLGADVFVEFESFTGAGVKFADDQTDPAIYAGVALSVSF